MPRIPVKKTRVLTRVEEQARLVANAKFKISPLGLQEALIKMIERIDPLELVATVGLTFAIHGLIINSEELLIKARSQIGGIFSLVSLPLSIINLIKNYFGGSELTPEQLAAIEEIRKDPVPWLVSFGIAYYLIKNKQTITDLTATVAGFFGLVPI